MTGQHAWGFKIAAYLFVSGMGAGAYAAGAVADLAGGGWLPVARVGLPLGPLLVGPATLFLIWDLGRPSGFLRAGRRPAVSWISRGVVILSAFLLVSALHAGQRLSGGGAASAGAPSALAVAGALLAVLTMMYTGLLLGAVRSIPLWSTPILPVLFTVASLSTGVMAVDLVLTLGGTGAEALAALRSADLALLAIEAVVIGLYLTGARTTVAARTSVELLTTGEMAPRFWGGVVAAGIAVPFVIQLVEVPGAPGAGLAVISSAAGLGGALMLRHLVIAAGVKSPLSAAGVLVSLPRGAEVAGAGDR
jgi:polysulfide reductase chain C